LQLERGENVVTRETHKKESLLLCHQFDSILAVKKLSKQRLHAKHTFVTGGESIWHPKPLRQQSN